MRSGKWRSFSTAAKERQRHRVTCSGLFLPRTQPDSQQAATPSHKVLLHIRQSHSTSRSALSTSIFSNHACANTQFSLSSLSLGRSLSSLSLSHMPPLCLHQLLLEAGLIRQSSAGVFHLLPLGLRVLERLVALVDHHMQAIGGSKMALPILTPAAQWKTSGVLFCHTDILPIHCLLPLLTLGAHARGLR